MDNITLDHVQNVDSEATPTEEDCLSNSVIVRKILEHFSDLELRYVLQFVSKLWNHEARHVMKKRGNIIARLTSDEYCHPCEENLEAFGVHLRQMNVMPYSGISIRICPKRHEVPSSALDSTHKAILDLLQLKFVAVHLTGEWWSCKDCPTLLLLKRLLQDFSGVVEELRLYIVEPRKRFIEHFVQDCSFPRLRVLKFEEDSKYLASGRAYTNYMKALVSRSGRLQELHTKGPINLMENLLEGTEAVLIHTHVVHAPFERVSENVIDALRLTEVKMKYTSPRFRLERFNRITPMLLQASCTTLRSIVVDAVIAVPLMCYGILFGNVKQLRMDINYNQLERVQPQILRIVKNFDFTRVFPKLDKIQIFHDFDDVELSADHLTTIIGQADTVLKEPVPDRATKVKKLELILFGNLSYVAASFFAEMLPNIKKLVVETNVEQEIPFQIILKHWVDLVQLVVYVKVLPNTGNLDSVFCGVFPEEVAELRKKDEEYLKRVNIVPVMPAITCLKNLKALTLKYEGRKDEIFVDDDTFMFSKVTALIAFARCPALTVSLFIGSFARRPAPGDS